MDPRPLRVAFQPIVSLSDHEPCAYEALARFPGVRSTPDTVFAAAHACGRGAELEALAIQHALAAPDRPRGAALSVNVSPPVLGARALWRVLPDCLEGVIVEVTERDLYDSGSGLEHAVAALRERGARIAVDDVGSGYAGLCQLVRVRPDIVKVDRELIQGAHADAVRAALLEALIGFAHTTGMELWAEGVEDQPDLDLLEALGADAAQGFLLGRPSEPCAARRAALGAVA
jgi:EAL domain-containing protein (putative c-di-GMP-specific phosphodiesterase class I)